MILLAAGIALIAGALTLKYDRTMPTWARTTIMLITIIIVATATVGILALA